MNNVNNKKPKARKDHICSFCTGTINKGEVYNSQTNTYEGEIYVWKSHIKCSEIAYSLRMFDDADEGVTSEDFVEYINNEFYEIDESKPSYNHKQFLDRLDVVIAYYESLKALAPKVSSEQRVIIMHTCGLDQSNHQYRNRYILAADAAVPADIKSLIEIDVMAITDDPKNTAYLTKKGLKIALQIKYKLWL